MRPRVAHLSVLVLWGCLRPNPGFDGASDSASTTAATTGTTTGTGTLTTSSPTTGPASTTEDVDPTAVAPSTTTSTTSTTVDSTTGLPGPVTLRPYELANCVDGPFCMSGGDPVSAKIEAVECFTAPAPPPLQLTRLGFQIRFAEGEPTAKLDVLPTTPPTTPPCSPSSTPATSARSRPAWPTAASTSTRLSFWTSRTSACGSPAAAPPRPWSSTPITRAWPRATASSPSTIPATSATPR
ncbi:hypothetical protein [Nannocystis pusilla]|uniref:hypothetical protein n=1 Tax=Nannocystis pusilla TaxID=889268 RepID=UPI003B7C933C